MLCIQRGPDSGIRPRRINPPEADKSSLRCDRLGMKKEDYVPETQSDKIFGWIIVRYSIRNTVFRLEA